MKTYEFSIVASGLDPEAEGFESRFYDTGCDDALVVFQKGRIIVDFAREAESLEDAISSAVEAVNKVGAKVDRVEPDPLVSLADISDRTGLTRSAISLYAQGERAKNFPAPVARVTSKSPLWDWATVTRWMYQNRKIGVDEAIAAETVKEANEAIGKGEVAIGDRLRKHAEAYSRQLKAA